MHLVPDRKTRRERRLKRKKRKSLTGQSVLLLFSFLLLFTISFLVLELPTASPNNFYNFFQAKSIELVAQMPESWQVVARQNLPYLNIGALPYEVSNYTLLAPVVVALGYAIGPGLAFIATASYLCFGIISPLFGIYPFADGGGTNYYLEPGFGYLVGLVAAAWVCGRVTLNKRTSLSQLVGVLLGLLCLHAIGSLYLFGAYLAIYLVEGSKSFLQWQPWIFQYVRNLTWYSLPYDVIFSIFLVGCSFPMRWLVKTLTNPYHSAQKNSGASYKPQIVEELGVS